MEESRVSAEAVTKLLKGLNPSKALGTDELHPRVLKDFASELCPMFAHLFHNLSTLVKSPRNGHLQTYVPYIRKGIGLWLVIIYQFLLFAYHANYLNILFAEILWHTWMNI